jgi:predicted dehydrogenase
VAVRVAFLGLGRIASLLEDDTKREKPASHAGAFAGVPGTVLAGGWDLDSDRRLAFAERWSVPSEFAGPTELLKTLKPDVLVVATWPSSHASLVELACSREVPVVVCEKPLTADLAEARRLVRRVAKTSTKVMVNHERRYARDYLRVRSLIREGTYGRLATVAAKLFMGRGRSPGEVLLWDGTHLIDILRFLTGEEVGPLQTWGRTEDRGGSLTARLTLGDVEVFIETASNRDHLVFELDLSFERGRVRIGNGLYEEAAGGVSPFYDSMRSLLPVKVDPSALYPTGYFSGMAEDAVRAAAEPGYRPVSTIEDGLAALAVIERILRASGSSLKRIAALS